MATPSPTGKYVTAVFNVWYDAKQDNVHVTSSDKDFGPNGVHMSAKRGTMTDKNLRTGLEKNGFQAHPGDAEGVINILVDEIAHLTVEQKADLFKKVLM